MREIKFRAWDDSIAKMLDCDELLKTDRSGSSYYGIIDILQGNNHHYHLMQYTGLKDKNEVEIYEGDIMKIHVVSTPEDVFKDKPVVFHGASFCVVSDKGEHSFLEWIHPKCLEVISNIHQNPELLTQ